MSTTQKPDADKSSSTSDRTKQTSPKGGLKPIVKLDTLDSSKARVQHRFPRSLFSVSTPKYELPEQESDPRIVYELIHNELALDGSAGLNLATFVTTWMEPEAELLMRESLDRNMIDKDEYPQTAEIEERCINMVTRLFHAPETGVGVSTVGSSEAVMLAGLALKWNWRKRRKAEGKSTDKPNLIMGSNVQVVWEKFARYWDVEPRYLPMEPGRYVIAPEQVVATADENTIGVVAILGTTYTGEFEPIKEVHDALVALNEKTGWHIPLHVDGASGAFVAPFLHPDLEWDFRLPLVKSINASGHKYGLVYPGVGWVAWRDHDALPEELVFHVNYLGGDMPTFTLNFSRSGSQIVGQYYNFLRLGRSGYTRVMQALSAIAQDISKRIAEMGRFELLADGTAIPVVAFRMKDTSRFSEFDLSDKLRQRGWQVPAYTMPAHVEDMAVLRIVVREGLSRDMADRLLDDLAAALESLDSAPPMKPQGPAPAFSH